MAVQPPIVQDAGARACLAAASAATTAVDYLLCATREAELPNVEEIATALADALNIVLAAYPVDDDEVRDLHLAACRFLGLDHPALDGEGA